MHTCKSPELQREIVSLRSPTLTLLLMPEMVGGEGSQGRDFHCSAKLREVDSSFQLSLDDKVEKFYSISDCVLVF